jgi:pheromone shutdown protein TraB
MLNPKKSVSAVDANLTFWQKVQQIQTSSGMSKGSAIGTLLLTQVQDDYAKSLGVELGGEFQVAWEYCLVQKPIVILGDRPLQITLVRAWESLSWFGKIKVLAGLVWSSIQTPNPKELREWMQKILEDGETDVLTESMAELRKSFPSLERVILKERDAYLACKLYQTCRYLERSRDHVIVAIVGAGHTPGICDWLTNGNGQTPEEVLRERLQTKKWGGQEVEALVQEVTQLPVDTAV